jgi:hypothetical protein
LSPAAAIAGVDGDERERERESVPARGALEIQKQ